MLPAVIAVLIVVTIAASRIFDPFSGDQALFLVGAKTLHAGGALYRDYWDIKQPGIFAFFLAAGVLFGFTQTGPHVLDVVWETAFAIALVFGLRRALPRPVWAASAPLVVVGSMFAGSSPWHLLQVEELACFPLFASLWAAEASLRHGSVWARRTVLSGTAAGVVVLFKIVLLPVALASVSTIAWTVFARPAAVRRRFIGAWLLGFAVPPVIYAAYAVWTGTLSAALETALSVPFAVVAFAPHAPIARLADSALHLLLYFRGIIVLGALGAVTMGAPEARPWRNACLAWIASGTAVILAQADSWWQYQFVLIVPPIAVLATFGIAFLGERIARGGRAGFAALTAAGVAAYVAVPLPQGALGTLARVARERPFASPAALERYRITTSAEYAAATVDAAYAIRNSAVSGPIYVFGNPLVYVTAARLQAVALTSWASYLDPPAIWARLDHDLSAAPPPYIFVADDHAGEVTSTRSPTFARIFASRYVLADATPHGNWYRRRDIGVASR